VSSTAWSPDLLAQALEVLVVHERDSSIVTLRPIHADSVQLGWSPGRTADAVLKGALRRYGLSARVLHSTSWRHEGGHVVLTYLAVVTPPERIDPNLTEETVDRTALARGERTAAPATITVDQVLEHALRHLAWLVAEDPVIAAALPEWRGLLAGYLPEPFAAL
jgi:hypothetical protein